MQFRSVVALCLADELWKHSVSAEQLSGGLGVPQSVAQTILDADWEPDLAPEGDELVARAAQEFGLDERRIATLLGSGEGRPVGDAQLRQWIDEAEHHVRDAARTPHRKTLLRDLAQARHALSRLKASAAVPGCPVADQD